MVTDEMVKHAAILIRGGSTFSQDDREEMARSILEAALSAAEPIRWIWEERRFAESDIWDDMYDDDPPAPHKHVRNIRPLYAAPPAPSVAMKAQQAVWIKHDGKSMPVNAETIVEVRMASGFEHEADLAGNWLEREGSKSNWHHDIGCPHPCDIVAYHIVPNSPALSAQVQDVAGWQAIETAPKDGTLILVICDGEIHTARWLKTNGVIEADFSGRFDWEGWQVIRLHGFQAIHFKPTLWMPLPATPAKQEG